jgi:hypothetical protein
VNFLEPALQTRLATLWIRLGSFAGDGRSFGELLEDQDEGFKRARYKRAKKKGYARETELSS